MIVPIGGRFDIPAVYYAAVYCNSDMDKTSLYLELEKLLELPPGSVRGDQSLTQMPEWDSLAVISFIAMVDNKYGVILQGSKVEACTTVDELVHSIEEHQKPAK